MQRRIQRKPVRSIREKVEQEQQPAKGFNLQGAIAVLSALTGIVVAVLWLAGRFYAAGYFSAMNIPNFQVNFSVWEYAEVSWLRLLSYFAITLYPIAKVLVVGPLAVVVVVFILQKLFPKLRLFDAARNLDNGFRRLQPITTYLSAFVVTVILLTLLIHAFFDVYQVGEMEGKKALFSGRYAVQVYSKDYLPLGSSKMTSGVPSSAMQYDGLRLLTFNNGKYYLFREVDPATCKPSQVFVVTDSPDITVVLSAAEPIDTPCTITTVPQ